MKDDSPLTAQWLGENMKLVHYLLKKRGICESWTPDYDDIVQNVVYTILKNIPKYKPEVASKSVYIKLLVMQEVCRPVKANIALANSTEQIEPWHDALVECDMTTQLHAEREFYKLTEVQQMLTLGYRCKEIAEILELSPDYIRNKRTVFQRGQRYD